MEKSCRTSSLEELPPDRRDLVVLRSAGSNSLVSLPLQVGGQVVGILNFGTLGRERQWQPDVVNRFRLIAQVFAGALARKRADRDLRAALSEVEHLRDRLRDENEYLKREVISLHGTSEIVGNSQPLKDVLAQAQLVAATGATVLLLGETGTGKELLAAQIHGLSARRGRLMVRVNCAAIPAALIESELFGREKGAYTGALSRQLGRFEVADARRSFWTKSANCQSRRRSSCFGCCRRKFERLGSTQIRVDVRIIAATNRDLERPCPVAPSATIWYYRLNVFPIRLPAAARSRRDCPRWCGCLSRVFAKASANASTRSPSRSHGGAQRVSLAGEHSRAPQRGRTGGESCRRGHVELECLHQPAIQGQSHAKEPPHRGRNDREHIRTCAGANRWRVRGAAGPPPF